MSIFVSVSSGQTSFLKTYKNRENIVFDSVVRGTLSHLNIVIGRTTTLGDFASLVLPSWCIEPGRRHRTPRKSFVGWEWRRVSLL